MGSSLFAALPSKYNIISWLARACMGITLITLPLRYRFTLIERPNPPIYIDYLYVLIYISDLALLLTLVFWLVSLKLERRRLKWGPRFLSLPLGGLLGVGLLSSFFSIDPLLSFYHTLRLVLLAGFALYVLNEIYSLDMVILPVFIQVFIQSIIGVVQVLQQRSLGLVRLGELELDPEWSGVSIVWAEGVRSLRAYGLTDHPNILGGSLAFGLLLIAGWFSSTRTRHQILVGSIFSLGLLCLLLTFSRSAWLAIACGFLILAGWLWRTGLKEPLRANISLGIAGLLVLLPFAWHNADLIGVRFNRGGSFTNLSQENQAIGERTLLMTASNQIFFNKPFTGSGLGTSTIAMKEAFPDFPVHYQPAHFVLVVGAAETGILGAVFMLLAMIGPWIAMWFSRKRLVFSPPLITTSGLLAAVTLVGFFDYYTWLLPAGRIWQWFAWGLWGSIYLASLKKRAHD
jgi:O-antigen ligase